MGMLHFSAFAGVIPLNIRINFSSPETRMIFLPDAENCTIVYSFVCTKHRNMTDKQRDEETVDRIALAITSEISCHTHHF